MKLAICFCGQPRFLGNTSVYERYKEIIERYSADTFVHSWISKSSCNMESSDWAKGYSFVENAESDSIICSMYKPKKFRFDKPFDGRLNETDRAIASKMGYYTENNERNLLSHLKSYSEVIKLIDTPENYDFILMTRFDAMQLEFPNLDTLDSSKFYLTDRYAGGWCDVSQLCGGSYAKAFNVFDNFGSITKILSDKGENMIAEVYKRENYNLYHNEDNVRYIQSLSSCLVRSEDGLKNLQC